MARRNSAKVIQAQFKKGLEKATALISDTVAKTLMETNEEMRKVCDERFVPEQYGSLRGSSKVFEGTPDIRPTAPRKGAPQRYFYITYGGTTRVVSPNAPTGIVTYAAIVHEDYGKNRRKPFKPEALSPYLSVTVNIKQPEQIAAFEKALKRLFRGKTKL